MAKAKRSSWQFIALIIPALLALSPARSDLFIAEMMADNRTFLPDQDKDCSDWIEILNAGAAPVNLDGYFLADDPLNPDKWQIPAVTLAPRRFLVVFCSGKNRRNPASELHASFKLKKEGGKVFLNAPDQSEVVSVVYLEQAPDASYGMTMETSIVEVVATGAPVRIFIPTNSSLGLSWTLPGFNDTSWREGTTGIGFGVPLAPVGTDVGGDMQGKNSSIFIRIPFDVPDPSAVDFLTLRIAYDDGFAAFLNGSPLASRNAPATLLYNSAATAVHAPGDLEEVDISGHLGDLRPGRNILAIQGLNRTAADADFLIQAELDLVSLGNVHPEVLQYFQKPTPGRPNGQGFPDMTPRPIFSQGSKAFTESRSIGISTALEGASIRYTLDGTRPGETSTLYTGPIAITGTTRITARVFKDGLLPGIADSRVYTVLASNLLNFRTNLPLVICSTLGQAIGSNCGDGPYTPGLVMVLAPGPEGTAITDEAVFADSGGFRKRGSSTCGYEKFAFNVQIWDEAGLEKEVQVLDFPADSDYVMHGSNNFDRSNLHNPLAYWLSRQMGRWAPRTQFVECFFQSQSGQLNAGNYFGIYAWMEKNKRGSERIDVEQLDPSDNTAPRIEGGYILKRDRASGDEVTIGAGGYGLVMVYPKQPTSPQISYIAGFINGAVASLNPNIGSQEDSQWIDVGSWIDHHILSWYPKNVDAFRLSGYMFKTRKGRLEMGPVWDYDRSMGGADDNRSMTPEGWYNDSVGDGGTQYFAGGGMGSWYGALFQNQPPAGDTTPWNRAYRARWKELRKGPLLLENIDAQIDAWADELRDAAVRNAARWSSQVPRFGSFQGEVDHLKNWLKRRTDWIDAQFMEVPRFSHEGGMVDEGLRLEILIGSGAKIYYTLDGTDPKGTGDLPAPSAVLYSGPIAIDRNMKISARALEGDFLWSALVTDIFLIEIPALMVTEIMYAPPAPTTAEDPDHRYTTYQMEFLEIKNVGQKTIALSGLQFSRGPVFKFSSGSVDHLDPGGILLVVSSKDGFKARYGTPDIAIAGQYTGNLSDVGAIVTLLGPLDETILDFSFFGSWYPGTRRGGYSLVNVDPQAPPDTLSLSSRWMPGLRFLGTPGIDEPAGGLEVPGDLSQDGRLDLSDSIALIFRLFAGLGGNPCDGGRADGPGNLALMDWNRDRAVDVADVIGSLSFLFLDGPPHALGSDCALIEACPDVCGE